MGKALGEWSLLWRGLVLGDDPLGFAVGAGIELVLLTGILLLARSGTLQLAGVGCACLGILLLACGVLCGSLGLSIDQMYLMSGASALICLTLCWLYGTWPGNSAAAYGQAAATSRSARKTAPKFRRS